MTFPVAPILPGMVLNFAPRSIIYLDCSRGIGFPLMAVASEEWLGNVCCVVLQM